MQLKPKPPTDEILIQWLASKEERLQKKAYQYMIKHRQFYLAILAFVKRNNGKAIDAEDVFQEAWIAIWTKTQTGKFTLHPSTKLSTFFFEICRRLWLARLRNQQRLLFLEDIEEENLRNAAIPIFERYEEQQIIRNLVETMQEPCKTILINSFWKNWTNESIGVALNMKTQTIKNKKGRCKKTLKERILKHKGLNQFFGIKINKTNPTNS